MVGVLTGTRGAETFTLPQERCCWTVIGGYPLKREKNLADVSADRCFAFCRQLDGSGGGGGCGGGGGWRG